MVVSQKLIYYYMADIIIILLFEMCLGFLRSLILGGVLCLSALLLTVTRGMIVQNRILIGYHTRVDCIFSHDLLHSDR